jgi:hypothetical protein
LALLIAVVLTLLTWWILHSSIKKYRSEICQVFHSYRANFVFGHLIQSECVEQQSVSVNWTNVTPNP